MSTVTEATTAVPEWFTAAIAEAPDVFETRVRGARIQYLTWGSPGPRNIVLVHGGAAHAHWWDHIAPRLTADGMVVALDLSGHGDSDHRPEYSVETWADEILAVARDAGLPDGFTLIGHSLGGLVTTQLAQLEGSPVGSAIVVDSPVSAVGATTPIEANGLVPSRRRVYESPERMIARFRPVPDQSMLPYVASHIAALSVTEVEGGWSWKFDSTIMSGEVLRARFDRIHRPLAFLRSEFGVVTASARAIVEPSGAMFVEMMDAGHAPMLDQPVALITAFRAVFAAWDAEAAGTPSPPHPAPPAA